MQPHPVLGTSTALEARVALDVATAASRRIGTATPRSPGNKARLRGELRRRYRGATERVEHHGGDEVELGSGRKHRSV